MKSTCFFILLLTILAAFRSGDSTLEIGAPIPKAEVVLHDVSGREITLNEARGSNGLLVMFSGNHCPYVIRNQCRTVNICTYALKHQVGVILINSNIAQQNNEESLDAMKAYAVQQQYSWFYAIDRKGEIADAFDAGHTPECYLFDKNGRLTYKGAIDDNPGNADAVKVRHLYNAMNEMLAGGAVKLNTTTSLGCSIRRF
jgi:hypothetical protein